MTLCVPHSDDPELSVVMVSRGGWDLIERAVSNLVEHTERSFELILVDNDSDERTRARLAELRNVRLTLNQENRGFGPASNQGAAEARGDHLLLLNTDVFVHPGWLEPLLEALDDAGAGAAVPRYLNLDGSLQEAGALVARDGTVMPYGSGDDPELPHYRFPRRVDYGSAACMLIRREDFVGRGGFDERYAPAYFEDVDFCMRLARDDLSVVFEPKSTVTHVGQGSGVPSAAVALSERNHRRFFERWGDELGGRPWTLVNASEQAVVSARDALASPRVLICSGPREPRAEALLEALVEAWPRARVTWGTDLRGWGTDLRGPDGLAHAGWLAWGVEVAARDDVEWLGNRLFHYDLVVHGARTETQLVAAIKETQPQAPCLSLGDLPAEEHALRSGLKAVLAAAGIAPQTGSW
jgi:GT2 family glycosyltransferase